MGGDPDYQGSENDHDCLIFDLECEFHAFKIKADESISSYHSRFQVLCDKMKAAGIDMTKVNTVLPFIHGVDSQFTTTKRVMLMNKDVKLLNLQVIAGKFAMEERDIGGSTSKSKDKTKIQGTALKLKKFLKLISSNGSDEEL